MIVRIIGDGCFLADKEVLALDPKRAFSQAMGHILQKVGLKTMEGYGLWVCLDGSPPLPFYAVERGDTPARLGVKQGDILYVKKETQMERRVAKQEVATMLQTRDENPTHYRECLKVARTVEAARQRSARRLRAMNLLGTEWTLLDPANLPEPKQGRGDDACAVCLQNLASATADPVEIASCAHRFHETCLLSWIGKGTGLSFSKCPVCRAKIRAGMDTIFPPFFFELILTSHSTTR